MADEIITRKVARAQGLVHYCTGKSCKRGHIAKRYVSNLECVICVYDKTKERQWHKVNPERHYALTRKWAEANPDKVREGRERAKAKPNYANYAKIRWHAIDPELRKSRRRASYAANRERAIRYTAEWAVRNPKHAKELKALIRRRRRSRELGSEGSHTRADLAAILKAQSHRCAYCRSDLRKTKRHVDHIQPLARGGSNDRANLQYLCAPCNLAKGARDPVEFAQGLGRLL
jgi:5-methylcytosine-specific restriction endonuclease McrA